MVYAFNGIQERQPLWNSLKKICLNVRGPWTVAGDFNCVLSVTERIGGNVSLAEIEPFKECVDECGLVDIYGTRSIFTWNNKKQPDTRIYSRLDRFLINKEWSDIMPEAVAHFHPEGLFDHTPCIVKFSIGVQRKQSFKYFNMWGKSDEFGQMIRMNWNKELPGYPMYTLARNLKNLKPALKELNRKKFSDIEVKAVALELKVKKLQEDNGRNSTMERIEEEHLAV
ncbi:hypothetical protein vseg_020930 [Gypsophila vaccaria]